jgi:predicted RNA-binding protein with PUA-like domain
MKTEPEVFAFEDLVRAPGHRAHWDGVRNYQARNMMRDDFKLGDLVLVYHSRVEPPHFAGIAEIVREAYPDPSALDPNSKYFDIKSKESGQSRWMMVDLQAKARFKNPVGLDWCRQQASLKEMLLLRKGQRLSIQPVNQNEWQTICAYGEPTAI